MAEQNVEGGGSFPLYLPTLLVLLTLVSGAWLVSQKLTSTRPAALAGKSREVLGAQTVEARLWEDPFKPLARDSGSTSSGANSNGGAARNGWQEFGDDGLPETNASRLRKLIPTGRVDQADVLILPAMIPGSFYSEDKEIRVRSRFAIGSALGQSGYKPHDAEHIGSVALSWPTKTGIKQLVKELNQTAKESKWGDIQWWLGNKTWVDGKTWTQLDLRYEWYQPKEFYPHEANDRPDVLVLWLNERYFEDEPLLRLSMLLEPIKEKIKEEFLPKPGKPLRVALIGPWSSAILQAILPGWNTRQRQDPLQTYEQDVQQKIRNALQSIDVYSATATAMDAVLVRDNPDKANPRDSVRDVLTDKNKTDNNETENNKIDNNKIVFHSFQNFVATDDILAEEMLAELSLRGVDFAKKKGDSWVDHLVLLSEWDTFYARMLWLPYAAKLAKSQGFTNSQADFIQRYIGKKVKFPCEGDHNSQGDHNSPCNLHSFVYLRGLDGQTVGNVSGSERDPGSEDATRARPTSLEDLRKWTPDANKAEDSAQFDYLSRLGEQLAILEEQLSKKGEHIKAVGIVGSDVYDTLLILQALRHRVPHALFFTTGLDARFWHPRELPWSRNLLVTSSYGLSLHPDLQKSVPPFRDNWQTAQFTAALVALGHSGLPMLRYIPPRRFEIGRHGPVDLSVVPSNKSMDDENSLHPSTHPPTPQSMRPPTRTYVGIGIVCLAAGLSLTFFCGPLRRLTWEASQYQANILRYREEDVGGIAGAWRLVRGLQKSAQEQKDRLAQWLWSSADAMQHEEKSTGGYPAHGLTVLLDRIEEASARIQVSATAAVSGRSTYTAALEVRGVHGPQAHTEWLHVAAAGIGTEEAKPSLDTEKTQAAVLQECEYYKEELLREWLDFLNSLLHRKSSHPGEAVEHTRLLPEELKVEFQDWWPAQQAHCPERLESPQRLRQGRKILDALLQKLGEEPHESTASIEPDTLKDIRENAHTAREASLKLHDLRRRWARQCRIGALAILALAIGLSVAIWRDTFFNATGELFTLTTGTSAWPAEVLRFAAFVLAISLSVHAYQSLQIMMFQLTRRFRFPLVSDIPLRWSYRPCRLPASPAAGSVVHVAKLWQDYQHYGAFGRRMCRIVWTLGLYLMFFTGLILLSYSEIANPLRGPVAWTLHRIILPGASLSFLFLTFMIIDAARLCQWLIQYLCKAPTAYPLATTEHFSSLRGHVDRRYLDEWLDLQLIADLTAHVGRLVYYPFIVFLLLLLARNEWWDRWPWPWALITIFVCNLTLAAASVIILQNAARRAKKDAETTLEAKVKRLQAATTESQTQNNANQAKDLLEEIRTLRRGAFAPFWENPVFRAILLPSGGTVVLQILVWLMSP